MTEIRRRIRSVATLAASIVGLAAICAGLVPPPSLAADRLAISIANLDLPEIERLERDVRAAYASADADTDTAHSGLKSALDTFSSLTAAAARPATTDPETQATTNAAKAALDRLAGSGIDQRTLTLALIAANIEWLTAAKRPAEAITADFVDLDRLVATLTDPAEHMNGLIAVGKANLAIGNLERASRYGQLAERVARLVPTDAARDPALTEIVKLIANGDPRPRSGLIAVALESFTAVEPRSAVVREFAARAADAVDPDGTYTTAASISTILGTDTLGTKNAAWLAAGRVPADVGLNRAILDRLIAEQEDDTAALLASALSDPDQQIQAIEHVVTGQKAQGRNLAALDTVRLLPGPLRAQKRLDLALAIQDAGYETIAASVTRAVRDTADLDPALRSQADALATAIQAPPTPRNEDASVTAARRLAEAGQIDAASASVAAIEDRATRERALAAVAVVEAKLGKLDAALKRVETLSDYTLRVATFRTIAEAEAARLDGAGRLAGKAAAPRTPANQPNASSGVYAVPGLVIMTGDGVANSTPAAHAAMPNLAVTAASVRAKVPMPLPGIGELSLAGLNRFTQLNRFNSKFLEDVVGTTTREHILKTQGTINPTFIFLTSGVFTVRDLLRASDTSSGRQLVREGGIYTLRVPLVIGPDATLIMSGQDSPEVRISSTAGAFIVNAGRLFVTDTTLVGWDEEKGAPAFADYAHRHDFRPFITTWSGSETDIAGARVLALGYSAGKSYGLTFSSGPKISDTTDEAQKRPAGTLVDSSFENLLYGLYTYEADDLIIIGNEFRDNIVYGLDPHDRSHRLVMAYNTVFGTETKHGVILSRDVRDSWIVGNLSVRNGGSGFMLDRNSTGNVIYANTGQGNRGDGMTVYESPCAEIAGNVFGGNERSGIKIRNSWNIVIADNDLSANKGPGIEGYTSVLTATDGEVMRDLEQDPYTPALSFSAARNTIRGNAAGISARGLSEVGLQANLFLDQGPNLFGGELKPMRVHLLHYASDDPVTVRATGLEVSPREIDAAGCPLPPKMPKVGGSM